MTKRAPGKFARRVRDFYPTPRAAVVPLLPHIHESDVIYEPCAGAGDLVRALRSFGFAVPLYSDILDGIDAAALSPADLALSTVFITNPPWSRDVLHPIITNLSDLLPTWLLLDADWSHTVQAAPFAVRCRKIVSVGRLRWIPDSPHTGLDNCAWYLFDKPAHTDTRYVWRLSNA